MSARQDSVISPSTRDARIRGLDGLRAMAASMIFFAHAWGHAGHPDTAITIPLLGKTPLAPIVTFGTQGVAMFFVLSGFLLSLPFWQALNDGSHVELGAFFRRRFLRIYPAYLVVVLFLAAFYDVAHPPLQRLVQAVAHLLLVHNFAEATIYNVSAPLWSVATEFQLYLILPVVMLGLRSGLHRGHRMSTVVLVLVMIAGLAGSAFWLISNELLTHLNVDPRLVQPYGRVMLSSPILGMTQFASGIAIGSMYTRHKSRRPDGRAPGSAWLEIAGYLVFPLAILGTPAALSPLSDFSPIGWPIVPTLFALLVLLVSLSRSRFGVAAVLELPPVRTLGMISYSFYLWHDFVLWTVFNHAPIAQISTNNAVRGGLAFLITFGVAWLSYQLLERRFGRLVARLLDRIQTEVNRRRMTGLVISQNPEDAP